MDNMRHNVSCIKWSATNQRTTSHAPRSIYKHHAVSLLLLVLTYFTGVEVNAFSFQSHGRHLGSVHSGRSLGRRCHNLQNLQTYPSFSRIDSQITTCSMSMSTPSPSTMVSDTPAPGSTNDQCIDGQKIALCT